MHHPWIMNNTLTPNRFRIIGDVTRQYSSLKLRWDIPTSQSSTPKPCSQQRRVRTKPVGNTRRTYTSVFRHVLCYLYEASSSSPLSRHPPLLNCNELTVHPLSNIDSCPTHRITCNTDFCSTHLTIWNFNSQQSRRITWNFYFHHTHPVRCNFNSYQTHPATRSANRTRLICLACQQSCARRSTSWLLQPRHPCAVPHQTIHPRI